MDKIPVCIGEMPGTMTECNSTLGCAKLIMTVEFAPSLYFAVTITPLLIAREHYHDSKAGQATNIHSVQQVKLPDLRDSVKT